MQKVNLSQVNVTDAEDLLGASLFSFVNSNSQSLFFKTDALSITPLDQP